MEDGIAAQKLVVAMTADCGDRIIKTVNLQTLFNMKCMNRFPNHFFDFVSLFSISFQ